MEYFRFLPLEITLDILTRLPTESVLHCKLVCKNWGSFVRHPSFSKMHLHCLHDSGKMGFIALTEQLHYFEYNENHDQSTTPIERIRRFNFTSPFEECNFLGSCNGLICLVDYPMPSVCICNPFTKEFVIFPKVKCGGACVDESVDESYGFGYVSSTNEYKVVVLILKTEYVQVHIYTLGSNNGWRNLGNFNLGSCEGFSTIGTFKNGVLYWLDFHSKMIFTFDVAEEKFCEHLALPPMNPGETDYGEVGVLDGYLSFTMDVDVDGDEYRDIWLLKMKNDNHDAGELVENHALVWTKEFRLDESKLLAMTKSSGVLTCTDNYINIYDTQASISKRLVNFKEQIWEVYPHQNSLVSLKELGAKDAKIFELVEVEKTKPSAAFEEL